MFHAHFMHYTESDHQKFGGTNTLLVQVGGGGLVSPGPHGCCAYVYNPLRKQMSNRFTMNSAASVCNPYFNTRKYKPVADMARAAVNL